MPKLYEINQELLGWLSDAEWDEESMALVNPYTGEVLDITEVEQRISELNADKTEVLKWLGMQYINDLSEAEALKNEVERLNSKKKRMERKADSIKTLLERECGGQKTDLGVVTVSYRETTSVRFSDEKGVDVARWLLANGHPECVKVADPEAKKTDVAKLLKGGMAIEGAWLEKRVSCSVK